VYRDGPSLAASTASAASSGTSSFLGGRARRGPGPGLTGVSASASVASAASHRTSATTARAQAALALLPATELTPARRAALWGALVVLQAALPGCPEAQGAAAEAGLHAALGPLLKLVACWAGAPGGSSASAAALHMQGSTLGGSVSTSRLHPGGSYAHASAGGGGGGWARSVWRGGWSPSQTQLAAAVLAASCGFTHSGAVGGGGGLDGADGSVGAQNKRLLAAAVEPRVAPLGPKDASSGGGGTLYQLLSLGLSRSVAPAARSACLALLASLARAQPASAAAAAAGAGAAAGSPLGGGGVSSSAVLASQLAHVAHALNVAIQKSLHASSRYTMRDTTTTSHPLVLPHTHRVPLPPPAAAPHSRPRGPRRWC